MHERHMRLASSVATCSFGISPPNSTGQVLASCTPCVAGPVCASGWHSIIRGDVTKQGARAPALQVLPTTVAGTTVTRDARTRQGATHLLGCPALHLQGALLLLCTLQAGSLRSTSVLLELSSSGSRTLLLLCSR